MLFYFIFLDDCFIPIFATNWWVAKKNFGGFFVA